MKRGLARSGTAAAVLVFFAGASMAQQTPDEIAQLKAQVQQLQQQLQALSKKLDEVTTTKSADSAPAATTAAANGASDAITPNPAPQPVRPLIASTTPMIAPPPPVTRPSTPLSSPIAAPAPYQNPIPESPLQIKIGDTYITPIGFMDLTGVWRDKAAGGSIGTSFSSIPYGNNIYQTSLSEIRLSMQNSRVGFRTDSMFHGAHIIGYMEADFLGNNPTNVLVSSDSNTMRSRLYWVDITKNNWELLGGQTWSLVTPGRTGINPLPGNIFYSQVMDVNYLAGLAWGRIPEIRIVYHAGDKAAIAFAMDNPEQYVGGSGGGPQPVFPAALTALPGTQLNNGTTTTSVPNRTPDFIAKVALDPIRQVHFEFGGLERNFKIFNPNTFLRYSNEGAAVFVNGNFEIVKGFRLITNNYWSDGGGRYLFGEAPDLIVRADGSISPVHSGGMNQGFEYMNHNTLVFGYYGGIYIGKNSTLDTNGKYVGYGYAGSASSQDRTIQEITFGFNQAFWKDPKYGALNLIFQYEYNSRNPWAVAAGQPSHASLNQVYLDLRYTLPGVAPAMK